MSSTLAVALGLTGSVGQFTNLKTGTTGYFVTGGVSGGEDISVSVGGGFARNMSCFLGFSINASGAIPGVSGSISVGTNGLPSGVSGATALGEGAAVSATYTKTFMCTLEHNLIGQSRGGFPGS